jgi:hypothetical protein
MHLQVHASGFADSLVGIAKACKASILCYSEDKAAKAAKKLRKQLRKKPRRGV